MTAARILEGLETLSLTGREADAAARMGFLEWVFASPGDVTPDILCAALSSPGAQNPESAAAQAFVGFLHEARRGLSGPRCRQSRARRLH